MPKKKTTEEFINDAIKVHGNMYDYSLVEYKGSGIKVYITCKKHGEFEQEPNKHLFGGGCPKCSGYNKTCQEYIKEASLLHNNKYDYSLVDYNFAKDVIKIIRISYWEINNIEKIITNKYGNR